jgi:hypothetical protein
LVADKLDTGDSFPETALTLVSGDTLTLPGGIDSAFQVVLFYRGHW